MDKAEATACIDTILQYRKTVKRYVETRPQDSNDVEIACGIVRRAMRGLRRLLKKCETLADVRRLVDNRYASIEDDLAALDGEVPSVARLERTCELLRQTFGLSIKHQDSSCVYSSCLRAAFGILTDRPSDSENTSFTKKDQDRIVDAVQRMLRVYVEFSETYLTGKWDIEVFKSPQFVMDIRDAANQAERARAILFRPALTGQTTYNSEIFEMLEQQAINDSTIFDRSRGMPHEVQELWRTVEFFDEDFMRAQWILTLPIAREYLLVDPKRYVQELKNKLDQVQVLMNADKMRSEWADLMEYYRHWSDLFSVAIDHEKRIELNHKLAQTRSEMDVIRNQLKAVRLSLKDIGCDDVQEEARPLSDVKQKVTGKARERWKSKFAGKPPVRGVIEVGPADQHGYTDTFYVSEYTFKLTAGKAGRVLDQLIDKQNHAVEKAEDRQIKFSKEDRNLFKGLKCISHKKKDLNWFFKHVIHLITDDHQKIVKAEFCPELFS